MQPTFEILTTDAFVELDQPTFLALKFRQATDARQRNDAFNELIAIMGKTIHYRLKQFRGHQDYEDLRQICLMSIMDALNDPKYDEIRSFAPFASTVMKFNLITARKACQANKRKVNYIARSIDEDQTDGDDCPLSKVLAIDMPPDERLLFAEQREQGLNEINKIKRKLSKTEKLIIDTYRQLFEEGEDPTYADVGERLNITIKAVDNGLNRIKRKMNGVKSNPRRNKRNKPKAERKQMELKGLTYIRHSAKNGWHVYIQYRKRTVFWKAAASCEDAQAIRDVFLADPQAREKRYQEITAKELNSATTK